MLNIHRLIIDNIYQPEGFRYARKYTGIIPCL